MKRPNWNDYFIRICSIVASRSTCIRRQVGAVIVRDNQILATGYNGAPKGVQHCEVVGCLRQQLNIPSGERHEICRASHAEQNAIVQAAVNGISIKGASLYCTNHPCSICAKLLINSEISTIYYLSDYDDKLSKDLLAETKIKIYKLKGEKNE